MKILVIGSGGREHALVWCLRRSPAVQQVYCVPGNAGIALEASCIPGSITSTNEMACLAETLGADLTVVGPEASLVAGIVDEFEARRLPIVGPRQAAAKLEGSKVFAKTFMREHHIPTADFEVIDKPESLDDAASRFGFPLVLKADGLAAGKGVVLVQDLSEARQVAKKMLAGDLVGEAGRRIVVERFLQGEEVSFIVLSDGERFFTYPPTQDHKPVFDEDKGPNTGGMGAYCDPAILPEETQSRILDRVVRPALEGLRRQGHPFRGFLYCGLMMTADGPQVLEFNVRMGDPEAQPLMYRVRGDLARLLASSARGQLEPDTVTWDPGPTACVVLASKGYPGAYDKGFRVTGLQEAEESRTKVFHAGTRFFQGRIATSGGRVLGVTAGGATLEAALETTYQAVNKIHFEGMHFRKDIGAKGLNLRR